MNDLIKKYGNIDHVYLWSNGNPYDSIEKYSKAISSFDYDGNSLHVVINTMLPVRICADLFKDKKIWSFHRTCSKEVNPYCMHGYEEFRQFEKNIEHSFLISRTYVKDITGVVCSENETMEDASFDLPKLMLLKNDNYDSYKFYPKSKYGESTGFLCYLLLKSIFGSDRITLCNFSVRDDKFDIGSKIHGLEFEKQVYTEERVRKITV